MIFSIALVSVENKIGQNEERCLVDVIENRRRLSRNVKVDGQDGHNDAGQEEEQAHEEHETETVRVGEATVTAVVIVDAAVVLIVVV